MKTNMNPNLSFGMALRANKVNIGEFSQRSLKEFKRVKPQLKKLAKDVDIFIQPESPINQPHLNSLKIYVQDITPPAKNIIQRIRNYFRINNLPCVEDQVFVNGSRRDNIGQSLIEKATEAKKAFLASKT